MIFYLCLFKFAEGFGFVHLIYLNKIQMIIIISFESNEYFVWGLQKVLTTGLFSVGYHHFGWAWLA